LGVEKVKIYETDKERILKLRKSGLSFANIGRRYSCSASAVFRHVKAWTTETFKEQVRKKVAAINQFIADKEANEEGLREYIKALFEIEDKEKKQFKVKTVIETEDNLPWACGSIEDDLDGILKQQGEFGLIRGRKQKIYKATEASKKAYLERQKYYKDSS